MTNGIIENIASESRAPKESFKAMESLGLISTQEISLGTHQSLAFEKPREVACLNETRFEEWIT